MRYLRKMLLLAGLGLAIPALAQAPARLASPAPAVAVPQLPPAEAMIILIRSTVVALGHANATNNYAVLHQLGSDTFRKANTPVRLQQVFTPFRASQIDMNPVVYLTPQLTQAPAMMQGRLHLVGFFPSQPMQINFDLLFEPSQGRWKLFGLGMNLTEPPLATPIQPRSSSTPLSSGR